MHKIVDEASVSTEYISLWVISLLGPQTRVCSSSASTWNSFRGILHKLRVDLARIDGILCLSEQYSGDP